LRFSLPTCTPISMQAKVVHSRPGVRVGVEFTDCQSANRLALEQAIRIKQEVQRRSSRIPARVYVMLYWRDRDAEFSEWAETVLLSRQGCLVTSRLTPMTKDSLIVWWADRRIGAPARVVSLRPGDDNTSLIALEFQRDANFWGRDFE
jgi:hypothetical protein